MRRAVGVMTLAIWTLAVGTLVAAQVSDVFRDPRMDFGAIQTVAVMPFTNLAGGQVGAERVRDVFINRLLATQAVYVLPVGEVARGAEMADVQSPQSPTAEEVVRLGTLLEVDAVITGVVREYGEVRSGTSMANIISMSIQIVETGTGRVVWSASSTKGKISFWNRLIGGGGQPMNKVTEQAIDALFDKLLGPPGL
jgi:curli biogenesis system outer membrane secretion channel CsgG